MVLKRCFIILLIASSLAVSQSNEGSSDLIIGGWGFLTMGRVGSGFNQFNPAGNDLEPDLDFSKRWLTDFQGGIKLIKPFGEAGRVRLHFGFTTAFQLVNNTSSGGGSNVEFLKRKFAPYLADATVENFFEIDDESKLQVEFGYMPVRYNPQATNLGEYLFRSTPYPTSIESGFELADKEKITGLHLGYIKSYGEMSKIKVDLYTFTGMKYIPVGDFSAAFLLSLNHENVIELGGGICFHNMISVDKRQTTPATNEETVSKSIMYYINPTVPTDTTLYTTSGTKVVGRVTLNPKQPFIDDEEDAFLGKEDLKFFAEIGIIGLKNYPGWYQKVNERMPIMFGINLPAFKLLDIISLQLQYWKNPYYNSLENMWKYQSMLPYIGKGAAQQADFQTFDTSTTLKVNDDDWKWSLYMAKTISKRVKISLQFANDNLNKNPYMPPPPSISKYTEVCRRTWYVKDGKEQFGMIWDWYWMGRVMFFF